MPTAASGFASVTARYVNMPPRSPTMISAKKTNHSTVENTLRFLFVLGL